MSPQSPLCRILLLLLLVSCPGSSDAGEAEDFELPFSSATEIRALNSEQAEEGYPVRIRGVVLQGVRPRPQALILWDGIEAIYIEGRGGVFGPEISPGDVLMVEGQTDAGSFAPMIRAIGFEILGKADLPDPIVTSVSEVAAGGFDATWVELEVIVHSFTRVGPEDSEEANTNGPDDPPIWILEIQGGDSRIQLRLEADLDVSALLDARVRFTGVCYSLHNPNRQFVRATMVVTGSEFVRVIMPAPRIEDLPITRIDELLQFSQSGYSGHRVKVRGTVTHHEPGRALWIRDGGRGLEVATTQATSVSPGELVEIVGFAGHGQYAPRLGDAFSRIVAHGEPPLPKRIERADQSIAQEANLIEIEGELTDFQESSDGYLLSMAWAGGTFQAILVARTEEVRPKLDLKKGSQLRLAGICTRVTQAWVPQIGIWRIDEFQVLLRSVDDISVITPGPWLTETRAIYLLAASAGLLIILIVAIVISARRAIARRGHERAMAEAEFSAMLKERNRVARDIHDTLAQGLNAVSMQLELAKNSSESDADASRFHVKTAHEIVRSCIADARESIWNMRSHVLDRTDLPGALEIVLRQLGAAHSVESRVEVKGQRRRLPPTLENDLLRVGQEAIANAFKHARATSLVVRVVFQPTGLQLEIEDNGCGFDPLVSSTATSRFGLKGMRERTELMHGALDIRPGQPSGTVVKIEIRDSARE